jgi:hypothetical protein
LGETASSSVFENEEMNQKMDGVHTIILGRDEEAEKR